MTAAEDIVADVRRALRQVADPSRAAGQHAYMKSAMPFLGVRVPDARRITRQAAAGIRDAEVLLSASASLWDVATHREEWYSAMALLGLPPLRGDSRVVPVVERMVREGRWWDITDELAHRIADRHDAEPEATATLVRDWSTDDDVWIRRVAVISQLGRRDRLDPDLLAVVIAPNLGDPDFFIRKAIGWALREYARVAPEWVRD